MNHTKLWLLALILTPSTSFAFFCPTNFKQIDFGYTIEQVTEACGAPDKEETREKKPEGPQEWSYYVPQTVGTQGISSQAKGTLKTQVAFDSSGKLINISVNGIGVGSTSLCGTTVNLGDSQDKVKAACGEPPFITKGDPPPSPSGAPQVSKKITEFTYNTQPPVKMIFEDGILKEKQ